MIDIRKLKELVRLMVDNDLTELDLRDQEEHVVVKRGGPMMVAGSPQVMYAGPVGAAAGKPARAADDTDSDEPVRNLPEATDLKPVESPMVGTFYASPDPDSPAFVSVGTPVGPDTVVCLVEAMKVFNEIKAECSGTIERILVNSGEPVEFGQKLFLVKPN